jgi:hypothetical protein
LWELALLSIGLEREKLISASLAEVVIAAGHNNKGGAAGDVLFMFVQLMDRTLDGTIDFDRVLQGIALPLRAECFQHGHSYSLEGGDSFATELGIWGGKDPAEGTPVVCSRTTLAHDFGKAIRVARERSAVWGGEQRYLSMFAPIDSAFIHAM